MTLKDLKKEIGKEFWDKYNSYYVPKKDKPEEMRFCHATARKHLQTLLDKAIEEAYEAGRSDKLMCGCCKKEKDDCICRVT